MTRVPKKASISSRLNSGNYQLTIRPAEAEDTEAIRRIQAAVPDCAKWESATFVAVQNAEVIAYIAIRAVADDEFEVLDLAVEPAARRRGAGRALVERCLAEHPGARCFLEVRESNEVARSLYESVGFRVLFSRVGYYQNPPESGIVMSFSPW